MILKKNPTLKDLQEYIAAKARERGFEHETAEQLMLLMLEECGELAKAVRQRQGYKSDVHAHTPELGHEITDVFIYLLHLCNYYNIDLEEAFRRKEDINNNRKWV